MDTKKTTKNLIWNTNRNYSYSLNRTSCRRTSKSVFGAHRRYC